MDNKLTDQELLTDALSSQKFITANYNTFSGECACDNLRGKMLNILDQEHKIQNEIFQEMQKRGWYKTEPAEQQKIQETKQKFSNTQS